MSTAQFISWPLRFRLSAINWYSQLMALRRKRNGDSE